MNPTTKPAACAHHLMPVEAMPRRVRAPGDEGLDVLLVCILCFKYAPATFAPLGYKLDATTARAMRARKKGS